MSRQRAQATPDDRWPVLHQPSDSHVFVVTEIANMLVITGSDANKSESLDDIIGSLEPYPEVMCFGRAIEAGHRVIFDSGAKQAICLMAFTEWMALYLPCLFGRLGAKGSKGVSYDMCCITSADNRAGDRQVAYKIQAARRAW